MYYKIGDVCQKVINVDGFDFKLAVKKQDYSIRHIKSIYL